MDAPDLTRVPTLRVTPDQARVLPNDPGHPSARVLANGSMEVRWFVPVAGEQHLPHDRDELYVVVAGTATFRRGVQADPFDDLGLDVFGEEDTRVGAGDVLFVPAGCWHRFEDNSADFGVWAIFYGPEGGER